MWRFTISLVAGLALTACMQPVLETEPAGGTVPHNAVVFVDYGTCPANEIKKITGGNDNLGVPRMRQCVARQ
jgi:hypothetical protein